MLYEVITLGLQLPLALFAAVVWHYLDVNRERETIRSAFGLYLPPQVVDEFAGHVITSYSIHYTKLYEVDRAEALTGQRPLARLHELGLVSPALLAVHMTQLSNAEITAFAAAGGHVVHCRNNFV